MDLLLDSVDLLLDRSFPAYLLKLPHFPPRLDPFRVIDQLHRVFLFLGHLMRFLSDQFFLDQIQLVGSLVFVGVVLGVGVNGMLMFLVGVGNCLSLPGLGELSFAFGIPEEPSLLEIIITKAAVGPGVDCAHSVKSNNIIIKEGDTIGVI